jgi:hypothetical protein
MSAKKTIDDVLASFIDQTDDTTIKTLLSESIDMAQYDQKALKLEKEIGFMVKAQEQQKKNETLLELAKRFEEALLKGTEKPVAMLKQIMSTNQAFALNKGFDKLTREEIIEIIKDKNLIDLLNKLDEE